MEGMDISSMTPKGPENGSSVSMALHAASSVGMVDSTASKGSTALYTSIAGCETLKNHNSYPYSSESKYVSLYSNSICSSSRKSISPSSDPFTSSLKSAHMILTNKHNGRNSLDEESRANMLDNKPNWSVSGAKKELDMNPENQDDVISQDGNSSDRDDEPIECGNCNLEFPNLQKYMDHVCTAKNGTNDPSGRTNPQQTDSKDDRFSEKDNDLSDGESFDGKIVYNPDGSAFIIEGDSDLSDLDAFLDLPQKDKLIIDKKGRSDLSTPQPIPLIASAIFVPRNPSSFLHNSIYMLPHKSEAPIMHSYKVYDVRSGKHKVNSGEAVEDDSKNSSSMFSSSSLRQESSASSTSNMFSSDEIAVPTKPILMCFVCKLSFGYAKSFIAHATNEHSMTLSAEENRIMSLKNSSAIIQGIGKEKEPLMSFLEPLAPPVISSTKSHSPKIKNDLFSSNHAKIKETTSVSYVYSKPQLSDSINAKSPSDQKSPGDLSNDSENVFSSQVSSASNAVLAQSQAQDSSQEDSMSSSAILSQDTPSVKSTAGEDFYRNYMSEDSESDNPNEPSASEDGKSRASSQSKCLDFTMTAQFGKLPGFAGVGFYGACEDHPNGRPQGVECPSCDMVLSSSQSLGGHMTMMHSRNSCKTLKCPKCNWHYKYQETLEIHMKEKHPDSDQKCVYCVANQPHPRLSRGENYSCGYKPYRCEVCNYSTTTKGNLSIHMQSDKHLNNVQDMTSGTEVKMQPVPQPPPQQAQLPSTPTTPQSLNNQTEKDLVKKNKPKPTWRCDVCNYETNVARNLRIHMTSEKHTHNMMVLQQNMKHMQRDMQLHHMNQLIMLQQDPSFMGLAGPIPGGITFPYDGSLLMGNLPQGFGEVPVDLSKENEVNMAAESSAMDASRLYQCCVCNVYGTDSLDSLHQHMQMDRTKTRENENVMVANGTYMCNLCTYKTNLKANFQLHCKTDKHLQRLHLVNHIKEGGAGNEWRLKYLNVSNPIQVRCNACDYYTNSIHKLQIHTGNPRHEASAHLFSHLQVGESKLSAKEKYYQCTLCQFNSRSKLGLMHHVHSVQHLHAESIKQMQMKEDGQTEISIGEVFVVKEITDDDSIEFDDEDGDCEDDSSLAQVDQDAKGSKGEEARTISQQSGTIVNNNNNTIKNTTDQTPENPGNTGSSKEYQLHPCPYCNFSAASEMHIQAHILSQHPLSQQLQEVGCPLCQEAFKEKSKLERHLISIHQVKAEALQRLMLMVEGSWTMPPTIGNQIMSPSSLSEMEDVNLEAFETEANRLATEEAIDTALLGSDKETEDQFRCQTCSRTFCNIDTLYAHQNELGHLELKQTPRGPGYLCWKKGCNQYFKTAQALQIHFREIHAKRQIMSTLDQSVYKFKCSQCTLAFKSADKLQLHTHFHMIKSVLRCTFCTRTFSSISALKKHVESLHDLNDQELEQYQATVNTNTAAVAAILGSSSLDLFLNNGKTSMSKLGDSTSGKEFEGTKVGKDLSIKQIKKENEDDMKMDTSDFLDNKLSSFGIQENGHEDSKSPEGFDQGESDEKEDPNDLSYKEQQFFEDYINNPAIAEGSYEDPSRKYKCHRCKVAFTKQHYLTAHNKTLMHRKGDRLSYPMEKYLDPNRPFKCDICKESFTQKNILLVHYNSVSHLHKVKQATQQGTLTVSTTPPLTPVQSSQPSSTSVPPVTTAPTSTSTSATASTHADKPAKKVVREYEDESMRPYKCNICKVAYSQGSTLDIHMRSVAHQTRASKLHELFVSGEVDINKPLIEEPTDPQRTAHQQQHKLVTDILQKHSGISISQPSLLFQGLSGIHGLPPYLPALPPALTPVSLSGAVITSSSLGSQSTAQTSIYSKAPSTSSQMSVSEAISVSKQSDIIEFMMMPLSLSSSQGHANKAQTTLSGNLHVCHRCSAVFANQESFIQHQLFCNMCTSGSDTILNNSIISAASCLTSPHQSQVRTSRIIPCRFKPQVQKNLLENIGFECVMQFNEFNQPSQVRNEVEDKDSGTEKDEKNTEEDKERSKNIVKIKKEEVDSGSDFPEMNKCVCVTCGKEFSSVWVLKSHQEEVHKEMIPVDVVEDFGEQFRSDYEKKQPKDVETPISVPTANPSAPANTANEEVVKQEMPPPPPPPQPQMDMSQLMNMFGMMPMSLPVNMNMAMNIQSSLMPMFMPQGLDPNMMSPLPVMDNQTLSAAQKQLQQNGLQNQKRARTRINDEQLKILRAHFDINNSPSEEQVNVMSEQSGLPTKVIKHWFRNTLFKERQRNKDSPYNFSVPPATTLDLEEYEKTGRLPVVQEPFASTESITIIKKEEPEIKQEDVEKKEEKVKDVKEEKLKPVFKTESQPSSSPVPEPKIASSAPDLNSSINSTNNNSEDSDAFSNMSSSILNSAPTNSLHYALASMYDDPQQITEQSPQSGSSGRRANRTRFTDFQIKVLQEYFEQNAYPKDDELEHLSKILSLSPRVIVVWFQNARQKARKIYENQPAVDMKDGSGSTTFQRTTGLNYQCKKCNAVFQRYYDLIRHHKKQCYVDSDQLENTYTDDDSDSLSRDMSMDDTNMSETGSVASTIETGRNSAKDSVQDLPFKCEKCNLSFEQLEQWREHQNVHSMNPGLFLNFSSSSAFGVLQNMAVAQQQQQQIADDKSLLKRKMEDDRDEEQDDQPRDKRLRTTILPEQLDYLYQKYQIDCNPSRKQLETISHEVGLKKRVVQVWFQNTRARERKGQYRAHQQLIHKRCPICRALFRAKSALESHLATKHPEEMAKGDINVDALPDATLDGSPAAPHSSPGMMPQVSDVGRLLTPPGMQNFLPLLPPSSLAMGFPSVADPIQLSMKQFYEDSFKKYINELSSTSHHQKNSHSIESSQHSLVKPKSSTTSINDDHDAPLDLSKPLKVNRDHDSKATARTSNTPISDRSTSDSHNTSFKQYGLEDSMSETYSEAHDEESSNISSNPSSPQSNSYLAGGNNAKRYRTQMTSLQVKIMKNIFQDYKTPTMAECEMLGREIGLAKRVVQVWFQNARAKEKKAKLNTSKTFGHDMDFPKPPEECVLCSFKYSHKYTIQDHIFTKKHIEKLRTFIQSQSDAERELSSSSSMQGMSQALQQQQADMDRMRKALEESSTQNQIAQLQVMGINSFTLPPGAFSGIGAGIRNPEEFFPEVKRKEAATKDAKDTNKKSDDSGKRKGGDIATVNFMHMQGGGFFPPLGSCLPGMDPNILPFMYPGMSGFFPGMGMPFLQPSGFLSGAEQLLAFDPATYGTPLPLLQIPQQAIKDVSTKLSDHKAVVGQYTQDCKSISSLRSLVGTTDYSCVREATVDVGYICKKCQMVYPAKEACINHQRFICFVGTKTPDNFNPILKLEQIQYECKLCTEKMSTVQEFKIHCQQETHKVRVQKYQHQKATVTAPSTGSQKPVAGTVGCLPSMPGKGHTTSTKASQNAINESSEGHQSLTLRSSSVDVPKATDSEKKEKKSNGD
ncbi:hypothetical protein ACJMK2_009592 [Sinanodonta woodiana]|uniref:Zinc finger homeobox protein 4 n=1 Tax=Sinanodonta woodiana TaxID=1069815 RepID=A0ABD3VCQ0_SINWO